MNIEAHVKGLLEKRMNVANQYFAELDAQAGREQTEEDKARLARMDAELDELAAEVKTWTERAKREAEAAELRQQSLTIFGESQVQRAEMTADQYLRAWASGAVVTGAEKNALTVNLRGAQRERELLRQGASADEIRALAWDTGSSASLVPTTLARTLYEYMEASNGLLRAPTTKIYTASGEAMDFPKLGAHAIATQVSGQGTTLAGTDPSFLKMTLNAYKYGELVKVSNEVLSDSGIDIAGFLGRDLGRALGRITATAYVSGSGSGAPNGLMTAITGSGTIATGGSLVPPTVEKLIDLQYSVVDEYRNGGSAGWLMHDSTAGTLRKLRDGAGGTIGAFLWEPSLTNGVIGGTPDRLLGHPVFTDSNVSSAGSANKTVAFGDMSAFYIRLVGNAVVERDDSRYFDTDEVGFRAKVRTDSDLIDTTAVNAIRQVVA